MSVAEDIRSMARHGLNVAEIASRLGKRYQHVYNVLKAGRMLPTSRLGVALAHDAPSRPASAPPKPPLRVAELERGGFKLSGRWMLSAAGDLSVDRPLPKAVGVYAFAKDRIVVYVGAATMGLAKRLYFYGKPGITQRTSLRLNGIIRSELQTVPFIEI